MSVPMIFDNVTHKVIDDLQEQLTPGCRVDIAAQSFSIFAFEALRDKLVQVKQVRFIFTAPAFEKESKDKQLREFIIPRINREKELYGTEFEIRLRNPLTQSSLAHECSKWVDSKCTFLTNTSHTVHLNDMLIVHNEQGCSVYMGLTHFASDYLGLSQSERSKFTTVCRMQDEAAMAFATMFESVWNASDTVSNVTSKVKQGISSVCQENSPEYLYMITLNNLFSEFLDELNEDTLPKEGTGYRNSVVWNKLYNFQKDAVLGIIHKLETYNGCILADSVGLGKTFTALAVIKYYESRNMRVLVLCPKKLEQNWNTYRNPYSNNPLCDDRLNYTVLFHTDLSRNSGESNGIDLKRINWGNFDLVVIDESHYFRNGTKNKKNRTTGSVEVVDNRYQRLLNRIIASGVKTKVLMLSATPVNNSLVDLKNQLQLAYEGNAALFNEKLNTKSGIEEIIKKAQKRFKEWSDLPAEERIATGLQDMLDTDFFKLLDAVTIARSRKHIAQFYDTTAIGKFPVRLPPINNAPALTGYTGGAQYSEIFNLIQTLNLKIYSPSEFIFPQHLDKYRAFTDDMRSGLTIAGRESGIRRLMSINIFKRMESSINSFRITVARLRQMHADVLDMLSNPDMSAYIENCTIKSARTSDASDSAASNTTDSTASNAAAPAASSSIASAMTDSAVAATAAAPTAPAPATAVAAAAGAADASRAVANAAAALTELEEDDEADIIDGRKSGKIYLKDMDFVSWSNELSADLVVLDKLLELIDSIDGGQDAKLNQIKWDIERKFCKPINEGNKKIIIFTAFADTARYLFEELGPWLLKTHGLHSALINGRQNAHNLDIKKKLSFDALLSIFSPMSKERDLNYPEYKDENIDLLIATDCISEGQNLQDCDCLINYDIHWNPVRIIQRFGRIDRIGSKNERIQLINYWPDISLDEYINLKARVESRMAATVMTSTGDDNPLSPEELNDLEYRKEQLKRLQSEVVDIEDMNSGISILDLGLTEFKNDLIAKRKDYPDLNMAPHGLHAIVKATDSCPAGVIFVLKSRMTEAPMDSKNTLHPYYMVYMNREGKVIADHLKPKQLLDRYRKLCVGLTKPDDALCDAFNEETSDGTNMQSYSDILNQAVSTIISLKQSTDINAFLSGDADVSFANTHQSLRDFELIDFLIIK